MVPSSASKKKTGVQTCKQIPSKSKLGDTSEKKSKLLKDKKFYLDVNNHSSLKKAENRLKSHGAALEPFLTKEVQYVLTDRQGWKSNCRKSTAASPSPSPSSSWISPSTVKTDSPDDGLAPKKTQSRVEAMLEKVRLQPQRVCAADPVQLALSLKIPIYSVDAFFRWLDRKSESLKSGSKLDKKSNGVRALKGLYLKVEPASKFSRPQFKEFDDWPTINFDSDPELAPFETNTRKKKLRSAKSSQNDKKASKNKMTRQKTVKEETAVTGYCEICSQRYCDLNDHITSASHIKIASDKANFVALDELISKQSVESLLRDMCPSLSITTASSCRRALRSGVKDLPSPCSLPPLSPSMGSKQSRPSLTSPVLTNGYHATRSTSRLLTSNDNCKEPLEVQCNGIEHCDEGAKSDSVLVGGGRGALSLRSMRSVSASCPGSTKDLSCRSRAQRNHWGLLSTADNQSITNRNEQKPKQLSKKDHASKPKRLSGEEKLLEDNKSYYKVEVLHTKLRSSGSVTNESDADHNERTKDVKNVADGKEPVVVRFHKVRRSELSLLSNEAENFMFGEPKRSASETSSDGENDSPLLENGDCRGSLKRELNSKSCDLNKKNAKRRTHAEAFIHDNFDYYKFEIPSSRLRFNNSYPPLCKEEIKKEYDDDMVYHSKSPYDQNFLESKDDTKDCERISAALDDDYKKITFSFEVERNTELWLQPFIRQHNLEEDAYPPDLYTYDYRILPFDKPRSKPPRVKFTTPTPSRRGTLSRGRRSHKMKGRKSSLIGDDGRPRKSPRCHASTLAILSTVTNRRRLRDSPDKLKEEFSKAEKTEKTEKTQSFLTDDENTRSSLMESIDLGLDDENLEDTLKNFNNELGNLCISNSVNDKYHKAISVLAKSLEPPLSNGNQTSPKSTVKALKKQKSRSIEDISTFFPLPVCMDVDPSILEEDDEIPVNFSMKPGPISDLSQLVSNSAFCCSLDRVNMEQSHRTVDFLRNFSYFDGSCNSSDCGASSTCEMLGFMEDGRTVSRKRKRKRPNMTGWPLRNAKRKALRQAECCLDKSMKEDEEHSVVVESGFNDKEPLIFDANNCESLSEKSILDMEKKSKYLNQSRTRSVDSEDSSESCVNRLDRSLKYSKSSSPSVRQLRSSSGTSHSNSSPKKQSVFKKHPKKRKKWGKKIR